MRQCELKSTAMSYSQCFLQLYVELVSGFKCSIFLKFLSSFLVVLKFLKTSSSRSFLNFRLSSTGLPINGFLIKKRVVLKVS